MRATSWSAPCTTAACCASPRRWASSIAKSTTAPLLKSLAKPNFMLKIIPHVDCTPRICELVRYYRRGCAPEGRLGRPAAMQLFDHALCDVSAAAGARGRCRPPIIVTDLTLGLGEVVFDYLKS